MAANDVLPPSANAVAEKCADCNPVGECFANALNMPPETSTEERIDHFIREVEDIVITGSTEDPSPEAPGGFEWWFSSSIVTLSSAIPANSPEQDLMINILASLHNIKGYDEVHMWKGMKSLGMEMREAWNFCPPIEPNDDYRSTFNPSQWLNFTSFLARLHQKWIDPLHTFQLWELKQDLEELLSPAALAHRMPFVREWLRHTALRLLQDSLLGTLTEDPEGGIHGYPYRGGSLYKGESGLTLERWSLWKRRLVDIRADADEDLRAVVDESIGYMVSAEKKIGNLADLLTKPTKKESDDN
ncbi:hypothetical protein F5B19DRAFT_499971 [Rostrohypoxylon terebratum]|nr:hypothetical protein F5B19DRAFT_499971 [Rostrohypoxylon terebratum]